ncbi:hypothetical protein EON80_23805, partial [bacterium]
MKNLQRGQRLSLPNDIFSLSAIIDAKSENLVFDVSCFGLDEKGHLSDERFFVFYNQPCAPGQCIQLQQPENDEIGHFDLNLEGLPATIRKLVWVLTIDGEGSMSTLQEGYFSLKTPDGHLATFEFTGADFSTERALMVAELYEREGWRLGATGQGFAGGLGAVVRHFGGQVEEDEEALPLEHHIPSLSHDLPETEKVPCDEPAPELPKTSSRPVSKPVRPLAPTSLPQPSSSKAIPTIPATRSNTPFETVMDFSDRLQTLSSRVPIVSSRLLTEEATKNALVMPFIGALGYDVFDPLEVIPEFIADYGVKKGEKVDYAIVKDDKIIVLFECKKFGGDLNVSHASQLFRYFSVTEARVGVLTNG